MNIARPGLCPKALLLAAALLLFPGCGEEPRGTGTPSVGDLPDFEAVSDAGERKRAFFAFLRPVVEKENARIRERRRRVQRLYARHRGKEAVSWSDIRWLQTLLTEYGVGGPAPGDFSLWEALLRRVDIVPLDLALAQAAKESGWGTSRFAREGNNLFGQRCFTEGCGIVPAGREDGATHEVKRFDTVAASVRSYIHNLNTNDAYRRFRLLRRQQRVEGMQPDGFSLAESLPSYSERGYLYLDEIREMIRANRRYLKS